MANDLQMALRRQILMGIRITDIIEEAVKDLQIPDIFKDEAEKEGYLAHLEGRDIVEALRYWWEKESQFSINHI